jgi:hypothetical protein
LATILQYILKGVINNVKENSQDHYRSGVFFGHHIPTHTRSKSGDRKDNSFNYCGMGLETLLKGGGEREA